MPGLDSFKPVLTALVLPPVPWLLLMLLGAAFMRARRRFGDVLLGLGAALIWLSACEVSGRWLQLALLPAPPPLGESELAALRLERNTAAVPSTAIVVLGAGRVLRAPESGTGDLNPPSLERLRYGIRLARQTGLPLAFSGGTGWAATVHGGASEAELARRIAERDFRHPVAWLETQSRDTRENAVLSVPLLRAVGIRHIVLVTHASHMPRAQREFTRAGDDSMRITTAPMGYFGAESRGLLDWLPSSAGFEQVRIVLRERLALAVATN